MVTPNQLIRSGRRASNAFADMAGEPTIEERDWVNVIAAFDLPAQQQVTLNTQIVWRAVKVDVPAILKIQSTRFVGSSAVVPPMLGPLVYAPAAQGSEAPPNDFNSAQHMQRGGTVLLDHAGLWWVAYVVPAFFSGIFSAHVLRVLVIDARNPITAAAYLSQPGTGYIFTNQPIQITATLNLTIPSNFNRLGLIIRNGHGGASNTRTAAYTFGDTAPTGNMDTTEGFIIKPGGIDIWVGDALPLGPLAVIGTVIGGGALPAAGAADLIHVTEFSL